MEQEDSKKVLRMIPYGLYVLMAEEGEGMVASSITWLCQVSFEPKLVSVALRGSSETCRVVKRANHFSINMMGKEKKEVVRKFFKHQEREGDRIGGELLTRTRGGVPRLEGVLGWLECGVRNRVEEGDHCVFISEVMDSGVLMELERADERTLMVRDLGKKVYYGG